ncbi:MAG: endolytic transglycosylase MltG [Muribaculum sp.]|nr:endolytic transglycosylase MltG [Muribaculum sp.]
MSQTEKNTNKSHAKNKKQPHRKHQGGKRPARILLWLSVAIIILAGAALTPMVFYRSDRDVTFYIPKDATIENVRDTLRKYFSPTYSDNVMRLLKVRNVDFSKRHGAYFIPKGTSPFTAMRTIARRAQTPQRIVINHFRDFNTLAAAISRKLDFSAEDFIEAATDSATLSQYGLTPDQVLSLFLEDTYEVYWSNTPQEVIAKIGNNYKNFWTPQNVKDTRDMGLTPAQLMIVASITDEETNKTDEKGRIGMLYINRLNTGMRLQADPTVRFAMGNFSIQRVTKEHLTVDSPYNTYRIDGLPPGPIRTTSTVTLQKIINNPPTDDLYMCAREDFSGYHNFAGTYEEHMKNALRYQHELDRRGIK